tara:strand:- start:570 stop:1043 length:474 start_codon:yes stop_codon:yes gene_type:complete
MAVLSKHIYTIAYDNTGNEKPHMVQGFNTYYGKDYKDVHYWCEDEFGKIIDTTPISYKNKYNDGEAVYIKWDNQEKCIEEYTNVCWESIMKCNDLPDVPESRKVVLDVITKNEDWNRERGCMMNAMAYQNKYKNLKVCVGSYGFKIAPAIIDIVWGN